MLAIGAKYSENSDEKWRKEEAKKQQQQQQQQQNKGKNKLE